MGRQYEITTDPAALDFEIKDPNSDARILQNVRNLIMTRRGEVPYDRKRGVNTELLDLPIDEMNLRLEPELDRVLIWEPRAKLVHAEAELVEDSMDVRIRAVVEIE